MSSGQVDNEEVYRLSASDIGVPLEITLEGTSSKMPGFIVDVKSNIIVKAKGNEELQKNLPNETGVTVRYYRGEHVYRFSSRLTGKILAPTALLFIEYPEFIQKDDEDREKQRIVCKVPCKLEIQENKIKAIIQNISPSGCQCSLYNSSLKDKFSVNMLYKDNNPIDLILQTGETKNELKIKGTMKYLTTAYDKHDIGIEFHLDSAEGEKLIEGILKR
ncbi:MAG: flagellar brake protein [Nitrospirae bacterium]|nr:flagellar brake protein [Nitrospirota bacterium]